MAFDRRNISIATYQMASDVAELATYLSRNEFARSSVWEESARDRLARLKSSIAEIEAVLDAPIGKRGRKPPRERSA